MKICVRMLVFSLVACLFLAGCGTAPIEEGGTNILDDGLVTMYIPCKFSTVDMDGNVIEEAVFSCDKSDIESGKLVFIPQSPFQNVAYLEMANGAYTTYYQNIDMVSNSTMYNAFGNGTKSVVTYAQSSHLEKTETFLELDDQGFLQRINTVTYLATGQKYENPLSVEKEITSEGVLLSYGDDVAWTEQLCSEDGRALESRGYREGIITHRNVNTFDEHGNLVEQDIYYSDNGKDEAVFRYTLCKQFEAVLVTEEVAALYPMFRNSKS